MLNMECFGLFEIDGKKTFFYESVEHYYINANENSFSLFVAHLNGNNEEYTFSSLSAAIEAIEGLENGEKI